jgi:hypothetical protein
LRSLFDQPARSADRLLRIAAAVFVDDGDAAIHSRHLKRIPNPLRGDVGSLAAGWTEIREFAGQWNGIANGHPDGLVRGFVISSACSQAGACKRDEYRC